MNAKDFAQKKDGWCGPAALSYALSQLDIEVSQEELAKQSGTTVKDGVDPYPLADVAKKHGATVETVNGDSPNKTLNILQDAVKENKSVIVDYLVSGEEDGGHYIVFLGRTGKNIRIFDPSGGKLREMDESYFISNWKDKTESGKTLKNWAMILSA